MGARGLYVSSTGMALLLVMAAAVDLRAELLARYSFDEIDGATALSDSVGTAEGILNSVAFVPSGAGAAGSTDFGNAGVFNGSDSVVLFGFGDHPESFDLGIDDFTIAGWFKTPTNFVNEDRIIFQNQSFSGGGWSLEIGRADRSRRGKVFFTVGGGPAATFSLTQSFSDERVDDDVWHWVAVSNSEGTISMYLDGVLQLVDGAMQPTSTATAPVATEAAFGARAGITPFEGQIDEWSIYNHALTGTLNGSVLTGGELFDLWQQGVVATTLPGDFNGDNEVDGRDFLAWQRGESPNPLSANDLADWQSNYGSEPLGASLNVVPEPSSCVLVALALMAMPGCARRFRAREVAGDAFL